MITGSALNLNFGVQNLNYSGKTYSIFGANLRHPNCDLPNITGCPIQLWVFYAKFGYYLLQQLLKLKMYYFNFSACVVSKIFNKIHFLIPHIFKLTWWNSNKWENKLHNLNYILRNLSSYFIIETILANLKLIS